MIENINYILLLLYGCLALLNYALTARDFSSCKKL